MKVERDLCRDCGEVETDFYCVRCSECKELLCNVCLMSMPETHNVICEFCLSGYEVNPHGNTAEPDWPDFITE